MRYRCYSPFVDAARSMVFILQDFTNSNRNNFFLMLEKGQLLLDLYKTNNSLYQTTVKIILYSLLPLLILNNYA